MAIADDAQRRGAGAGDIQSATRWIEGLVCLAANERKSQGGADQACGHGLERATGRQPSRRSAQQPGTDLDYHAYGHPHPEDPRHEQCNPDEPVGNDGDVIPVTGDRRSSWAIPYQVGERGAANRHQPEGDTDDQSDEHHRSQCTPQGAVPSRSCLHDAWTHWVPTVTPSRSNDEAVAETGSDRIPTIPRMAVGTR